VGGSVRGDKLDFCSQKVVQMFLRFVTTRIDDDSHKPQGVFTAAYKLLDSGDLTSEEWDLLRGILDWFNEHLPHPPKNFVKGRAIFRFKSSAQESVRQIWELVHLLRQHGCHVEVRKCRRLANIHYQDQLQVASYPSEQDGKVTIQ
jgi:hypothetical protein